MLDGHRLGHLRQAHAAQRGGQHRRHVVDDGPNDFSLAAALTPLSLCRGNPAPFLRLTIPDPFEYRSAARLLKEWPESSAPVTTAPQPVRR